MLHIMRELLQGGQWDRAGEWRTQANDQQNPNARRAGGVITFFTERNLSKARDKWIS